MRHNPFIAVRRVLNRYGYFFPMLALVVCPITSGCSADSESRGDARVVGSVQSTNSAQDVFASAEEENGVCQATGRLAELRSQRLREEDSYDYPVGPGDVLQVTIADLPEVNELDSRVNGQGVMSLPLIGDLRVSGLTEDEIRQLIADKDLKYQHTPRVHVFAQHFASRNVQVMGMIAQPGTYPLTGSNESILSVLGRAGGMKGVGDERASERVVIFPAALPIASGDRARNLAVKQACQNSAQVNGNSPQQGEFCRASQTTLEVPSDPATGAGPAPHPQGASVMPIIIDLSSPAMTGCLDIPARPGDVVLIPAAGQVGVYGWVAKPGTFQVTAGMTVLGAVTAAGGAMFSSNAEIMRTSHGARVAVPVNLSDVEDGKASDVPVEGGDVVLVRASALGAVPYAGYVLMNKFSTGLYLAPVAGL